MRVASGVLTDPEIAVIIGTIDRLGLLYAAIESLVSQLVAGFGFEVIVVDNAASAHTKALVATFSAAGHPVRYIAENRKGVSHARNTGVLAARAPIVAFMDDDQRAAPMWLQVIRRTFAEHRAIDFLGGRVRPVWNGCAPPGWLSRQTQGALSVIDRGDAPRPIDQTHWMCLPGGNVAVRRHVLNAVGGWAPFPRSQDRELTVRLLQSGHRGLYVPDLVMEHYLDGRRATRAHVRGWNAVEGRMRARYQFEELFDASGQIRPAPAPARRLAGVPLYLYGRLLTEARSWVTAIAKGRRPVAFEHELKVRYFASYIWERACLSRSTSPQDGSDQALDVTPRPGSATRETKAGTPAAAEAWERAAAAHFGRVISNTMNFSVGLAATISCGTFSGISRKSPGPTG